MLGRGIVARVLGDYTEARTCFGEGLAVATAARLWSLVGPAHNCLAIAAYATNDHAVALYHARAAYDATPHDSTALINLGYALLHTGAHDASADAFRSALARHTGPAFRLSVAGGMAGVAASVADLKRLHRIAAYIEHVATHSSLPYDAAQAFYSLWLAYTALDAHDHAQPIRAKVYALATQHGFNELAQKTGPYLVR
jgi:tetratricopeptide (TPR) repeat protein